MSHQLRLKAIQPLKAACWMSSTTLLTVFETLSFQLWFSTFLWGINYSCTTLKQDWEEKAVVLTLKEKGSLHLPRAQRRKIASEAFGERNSHHLFLLPPIHQANVCKGHPSWLKESWEQNEISGQFCEDSRGHVIIFVGITVLPNKKRGWFLPNSSWECHSKNSIVIEDFNLPLLGCYLRKKSWQSSTNSSLTSMPIAAAARAVSR